MNLLELFQRKSSEIAEGIPHEVEGTFTGGVQSGHEALDLSGMILPINISKIIQNSYLEQALLISDVQLHAALLNEFTDLLIYDDAVRIAATPNISIIFPQLMQCLCNDSTLKQTYVDLMVQDPLLAASVLRTSNSYLYNPSGQAIDDFDRAVDILGVPRLKLVTCTVLLETVASSFTEPMIKNILWPYTLHSAIIAQLLTVDGSEGVATYLSGLFHSVGEMIFLEQISTLDSFSLNIPTYNYLREQYFERLTLAILKDWALPVEVVDQVRAAAVTPAVSGNVENVLKLSSYCAKLLYIYQEKVWADDVLHEILDAMNLNCQQLDRLIKLSQQRSPKQKQ